MRTYGRITNSDGTRSWVEVSTDAKGFNTNVYQTALAQVIKGNRGESPFYNNYGIPAQQSVITQIFPDFYMNQTQAQFAQFFASLVLMKLPGKTPTYNFSIVDLAGSSQAAVIAT